MKKSRKYKKYNKKYSKKYSKKHSKKYSKKNLNKKYRRKLTKRHKYRRGGNEDDLRELMLESPGEDNIENILYPHSPASSHLANKSNLNNRPSKQPIDQYQSTLDKGIERIVNVNSSFFGPSKEKIKIAAREGASAQPSQLSPYPPNSTLNNAWNSGKDLREIVNQTYGIK